MVSIDASSGGILALYGGSDYLTNQVNSATSAIAQAGSTFKPFALVSALEKGDILANGYNSPSPIIRQISDNLDIFISPLLPAIPFLQSCSTFFRDKLLNICFQNISRDDLYIIKSCQGFA